MGPVPIGDPPPGLSSIGLIGALAFLAAKADGAVALADGEPARALLALLGLEPVGPLGPRCTPGTPHELTPGGRGEIRTHEGAKPPAGFQDRCLKPLGHPSTSIFQ